MSLFKRPQRAATTVPSITYKGQEIRFDVGLNEYRYTAKSGVTYIAPTLVEIKFEVNKHRKDKPHMWQARPRRVI